MGFDLDSTQIQLMGIGAVGLLTGTKYIVSWLRNLIEVDGRAVLWLATAVAFFQVIMLGLSRTAWYVETRWGDVNVPQVATFVMGAAYLTCLLASLTTGTHEGEKALDRRSAEREAHKVAPAQDTWSNV